MKGFQHRFRATLAAAALAVVGAAVVCAAGLWPLSDGAGEVGRGTQALRGLADGRQGSGAQPLSAYAAAWSRDLRRPLADAPLAGQAVQAQPAGPGLSVRLVGTIVDAQRPRGIFVTVFGQMELRGVGEKAGGAEVLRVDERSATLSVAGKPVTLKVEKPGEGTTIPGLTVEGAAAAAAGTR